MTRHMAMTGIGISEPSLAAGGRVAVQGGNPSSRIRVLTYTSIFPNDQQALHGLFVRERVKAMARICDVRVVAPVPWAPPCRWLSDRYYRYSQVAREEQQGRLIVDHPRFAVMPKVGKPINGLLMAASTVRPLARLRRTFPFDLLDAHWAFPDGTAAAILARLFRVPLAITVRGDDINVFARDVGRRWWIRWALRRADVVIALSPDLRQRALELGVPSARAVVVPNGVDTSRFHPLDRAATRRRLGLPEDARILLSVGRLHASKAYPVLVEVLARLRADFPDLNLVIVGESDPEADARPIIRDTVIRHGLESKVHLAGPQPPDLLPLWYGAADLFCLPTSREGSANVLLEALACGVPCITTPIGGNPQAVSGPALGLLTSAEPRAMAAAVATALTRSWDRALIAARGGARTWDVVADECCAHLDRIVRRAGRRPE